MRLPGLFGNPAIHRPYGAAAAWTSGFASYPFR